MGGDMVIAVAAGESALSWIQVAEQAIAEWGESGITMAYDTGASLEHLAAIAVETRRHASRHPNAHKKDLITMEDVVNSRLLRPLGLDETFIDWTEGVPGELARGYFWDGTGFVDITDHHPSWAWSAGSRP